MEQLSDTLYSVVSNDHDIYLKKHIQDDCDIFQQHQHGETLLMISCKQNSVNCVKLLCEQSELTNMCKTLINQQDDNGDTALIFASLRGHIECVKLLVEFYIKYCSSNEELNDFLNYENNYGDIAICCAFYYHYDDCVDYLNLVLEQGINLGLKFAGKTI